jgi:hypothetical protein
MGQRFILNMILDKVVYELANHGDPKSLRKRYVLADDLMSPVGASSLHQNVHQSRTARPSGPRLLRVSFPSSGYHEVYCGTPRVTGQWNHTRPPFQGRDRCCSVLENPATCSSDFSQHPGFAHDLPSRLVRFWPNDQV